MTFHSNRLESPSPKDALHEVGFDPVVLEKRNFKFLSSLGKGHGPLIEQTSIPFTQGFFVPSSVEIDPVDLEKKIIKYHHCIIVISLLSRLGKGGGDPHLNNLKSS